MRGTAMKRSAVAIVSGLLSAATVWTITGVQGPIASLFKQTIYAQSAVQLAGGNGLVDCFGVPLHLVPPGYALVLSAFVAAGLPVIEAARLLGALSAGLFAGFAALLLCRLVRSGELVALGILFVVLNPVTIRWHAQVTSDSLHASLVMASLALLAVYLADRKPQYLLAAAIAAGMASLTRFVGVSMIVTAVGLLLLLPPRQSLGNRLKNVLSFGIVSTLPMVLFAAYNRVTAGGVGGNRGIIISPPGEPLFKFFEELSRWFANIFGGLGLESVSSGSRVAGFAFVAVIGIAATIYVSFRARARGRSAFHFVCLLYVAVYFGLMLTMQTLLPIDTFSGRYILPLLGPLTVFAIAAVDRYYDLLGRWRKPVRLSFGLIMAALLVVPLKVAIVLVFGIGSFGFNQAAAPALAQSDLMERVRQGVASDRIRPADAHTAHFLLLHFDRCLPLAAEDTGVSSDRAGKLILTIDDWAVDMGTTGLTPPRVSYSWNALTVPSPATAAKPLGRLRPVAGQ
jgi:4-amino-4-deoxy-L-arabinose transferase-like glycosyltransferase